MAQSQNNVKVLPGWSAIGAKHIYPVKRKDHFHLKVVEQEGRQTVWSEIITGETLTMLTQHSQSWGGSKHSDIPEECQRNTNH